MFYFVLLYIYNIWPGCVFCLTEEASVVYDILLPISLNSKNNNNKKL